MSTAHKSTHGKDSGDLGSGFGGSEGSRREGCCRGQSVNSIPSREGPHRLAEGERASEMKSRSDRDNELAYGRKITISASSQEKKLELLAAELFQLKAEVEMLQDQRLALSLVNQILVANASNHAELVEAEANRLLILSEEVSDERKAARIRLVSKWVRASANSHDDTTSSLPLH